MRRRPHRVGVYGGSFDPIHCGHIAPIEQARVRMALDEVVFVPAFAPPHKPAGPSAPAYHRFAMAALALEPFDSLVLSDFEAVRGGTTYTVETLRHVEATRPESEVLLVVGSDSLLTFPSWRSWLEIVRDFRIVVVHREPVGLDVLRAQLAPELLSRLAPEGLVPASQTEDDDTAAGTIFWAGNEPVTISSTWIRNAARAGQRLNGSLPPAVERYLRRQNLYVTP